MKDYNPDDAGKVVMMYPRWIAPLRADVEEFKASVKTHKLDFLSREALDAAIASADNETAVPKWIKKKHPKFALHIAEIIEACLQESCDLYQTSYILATARHESVLGLYMTELGKDVGLKYEGRKSLGNTIKGDGPKFIGRGFVQLTGRRNYTMWMKRLKLPLLSDPDLVSKPDVAAKILVKGMMEGTFTGRDLPRYVARDLPIINYRFARRTVNGMDKAEEIAEYAVHYQKFLAPYFNVES